MGVVRAGYKCCTLSERQFLVSNVMISALSLDDDSFVVEIIIIIIIIVEKSIKLINSGLPSY